LIYGRELVRGIVVPTENLDDRVPSLDEMYIDLGRTADEVREVVEIGDPITFVREFSRLNDTVVTGRNFDDRIGTYCLLEAMRSLGETQVDVYAVSTVQEEVGVRGAWPAAYAIDPDIGIAIDGSVTRGPYNLIGHGDPTSEMGKGAGIYMMDGRTIGNPRLVRFLLDLGISEGIPTQRNIGGGTDAEAIQRVRGGAMATTVGAPVRYMHTTVQLCDQNDIDATVALIRAFLEHAHELLVIEK
jgi:endoglucanase